jgi:hypothetical protein
LAHFYANKAELCTNLMEALKRSLAQEAGPKRQNRWRQNPSAGRLPSLIVVRQHCRCRLRQDGKNKAAPASLIWPPMASVGSRGSDEYLDPAKSDHGLEAAIATR